MLSSDVPPSYATESTQHDAARAHGVGKISPIDDPRFPIDTRAPSN